MSESGVEGSLTVHWCSELDQASVTFELLESWKGEERIQYYFMDLLSATLVFLQKPVHVGDTKTQVWPLLLTCCVTSDSYLSSLDLKLFVYKKGKIISH